ncbi:MAG: helix-hairpin-helix domain-containing protein [Alistipes sp.]|nr:helix-hairpin-helix domain-containing protein [Alistipes sp.]
MNNDKHFNPQTLIISICIIIMGGCFIFMGVQDFKNGKSQVTITVTPKETTILETVPVTNAKTNISNAPATERRNQETTTVSVDKIEFPININTADEEELMLLDGIGEALSGMIIEYRNDNGYFSNIEEIMNVPGIGEGIFAGISEYIYVENPVYPTESFQNVQDYPTEPVYEYEETIEPEITLTLEDVIPIELNSADVEILALLPHVDENIAGEIIGLRNSIGGFSNTYELLYIDALTQQQVAEILDYVYVEAS